MTKRKKKKNNFLVVIVIILLLLFFVSLKYFKKSKMSEAPIIKNVKNITIKIGDSINLLEDVIAEDDKDKNLVLKVKGKYDFGKKGVYELYYYVKDNDGNETKEFFTLTVEDKNNFEIKTIDGVTYIDGIMIVNKSYGVPSSFVPDNLENYESIKMEKNALNHLIELISDAKSMGYEIVPRTAYRSYSFQKQIYDGYLKNDSKDLVDQYSARPGHSEHHTGLAVDVNSLDQNWGDTEEGIWLKENCASYGFIIRYPFDKEDITGYMYEPWHIRYVGTELSQKLYNDGNWITLEEYFNVTSVYEE